MLFTHSIKSIKANHGHIFLQTKMSATIRNIFLSLVVISVLIIVKVESKPSMGQVRTAMLNKMFTCLLRVEVCLMLFST